MSSPAQSIRHKLLNTFFSRHSIWLLCIFIFLSITFFHYSHTPIYINYFISDTLLNSIWLITGLLSLVGLHDVLQNKHSILKNYPIMGHFRFIFEDFRPEIRQYFIEADQDALPFRVCNAVWSINVQKTKMQINPSAPLLMSMQTITAS